MVNTVSRPSMFKLFSEPGRAALELGISLPFNTMFSDKVQGDGHPVMVLPGFMSSERSTKVLRNYIAQLGYDVHDWGLGRNFGKLEYLALTTIRVEEIHRQTGRPVSLVGWSLGGVFARQIAKECPDRVRQVITLASPFAGLGAPNNVEWLYSLMTGGKKIKKISAELLAELPLPAPVPTTAIYSKEDGLVAWEMCKETIEDDLHQNIEVCSSHLGMGVNFSVHQIIADRLGYHEANWVKFRARGFFTKKLLYPSL